MGRGEPEARDASKRRRLRPAPHLSPARSECADRSRSPGSGGAGKDARRGQGNLREHPGPGYLRTQLLRSWSLQRAHASRLLTHPVFCNLTERGQRWRRWRARGTGVPRAVAAASLPPRPRTSPMGTAQAARLRSLAGMAGAEDASPDKDAAPSHRPVRCRPWRQQPGCSGQRRAPPPGGPEMLTNPGASSRPEPPLGEPRALCRQDAALQLTGPQWSRASNLRPQGKRETG